MKSSGLKVIRNDDYDKFLDLKSGNGKKQKDLIKFGLFIALFLFMFGIIFFAKNRIDTYKNFGEDLNFQKQKILEDYPKVTKLIGKVKPTNSASLY